MSLRMVKSIHMLSLILAISGAFELKLFAVNPIVAEGELQTADEVSSSKQANWIQRHPQAVERDRCFPLEKLSESTRDLSKRLLLDALDSEALYTLVGDLKPISEGFYGTWFQVDPGEVAELSEVRDAIAAWQCGGHYETGVLPFQNLREGSRYASTWIAIRPALKKKLIEQADFFAGLGMHPESPAEAVLLRIEGAKQMAERW